eukprot:294443_1
MRERPPRYRRKKCNNYYVRCITHRIQCCSICGIIICAVVYVIINYAHHITCYFHDGMCHPISKFVKHLHSLQDTMSTNEYYNTLKQMWDTKDDNSICNVSIFKHPCPNTVKLGIVFAQRHGGTNWVIEELSKIAGIHTNREVLISWESNECSLYSKYVEFTMCDSYSLIKAM